eukprot:Gregarina_sp_Poly_1__3916@NODE_2173_length_2556_cov_18_595822_g1402_i0_p1_GENE_NODE_2173_length_2556_cov_18_595822_g1402_i0NODE_2173_length_2556_cov_18_595822_g1402_i0_p1_ORF_typecomplete_len311_score7_60RVP/PF00077_20/1_9e06RVP_2/PF08284_11/1_9e05gagasp_proteas/PF13975_6/0_00054Asp_protease/PF09668_10/0_0003Asp_protease_2/PF13650_6/0_058Peptidase_A2B/PF12384_8/3_1Peptidase_A2B/PF12384_8/4_5HxlR/PF01638_17/0_087Peptidase_A3/PF02160_15/0_34Peptidase_A3/PF02160_15/9_6e03HTH_DeoR/PF08220_12/3_1HTH_
MLEAHGGLVFLKVYLEGNDDVETKALLDTGAAVNCISLAIRNLIISARCEEVLCNIRSISSNDWQPVKFVAVPNCSQDIILGLPWIQQHRITFGLDEKGNCAVSLGKMRCSTVASVAVLPCMSIDLNNLKVDDPELKRLIQHFDSCFAKDTASLRGTCKGFEHEIKLKEGTTPFYRLPYRIPWVYRKELRRQLNELLHAGLIRRSNSPWSSPALFVPKKDQTVPRLVNDFRVLNEATVRNGYPLPRIDDLLVELEGSSIYTKLDRLCNTVWPIRVVCRSFWYLQRPTIVRANDVYCAAGISTPLRGDLCR